MVNIRLGFWCWELVLPNKSANRVVDFLKTLTVLGIAVVFSAMLAHWTRFEFQAEAHVIDGDSLRIGDEEVRLFGIDAPEYQQICIDQKTGQAFSCGKRSRAHLEWMIDGREVRCEGWERDKFDRLLGECHVGEILLNRRMVLDGWAVSFGDYRTEEEAAKTKRVGLWSSDFEDPYKWRKDKRDMHRKGWLGALFN